MRIATRIGGWLSFGLILVATGYGYAQQIPPFNYYVSATNLTGSTLKTALHGIISNRATLSGGYGSATKNALMVTDRDPTNSADIILIYSGYSVAATSSDWNQEHIWPQSYGASSEPQRSDLFNLRSCDSGVNSSRGNKYYDMTAGAPGYHADAPQSTYDTDSWEPRDSDKGYVARAAFYMSTYYNGTGGYANFKLADSPNAGAMTFGRLTMLLDWNRRFLPTDWERTRNSLIATNYQHNRNPFIDNPDFADMVFLGVDGFAAWQGTHFPQAELNNVTVSGAASDPDGDGMPNLLEYALGHDPHTPEPSAVESFTMQTVGESDFLYLVHHKYHYASGISFGYEISVDLSSWSPVTPELVSASQIDSQKDLVTVRLPVTATSEFVRFRIHRLAEGPDIVADGATITVEGCTPANGGLDPGESATVSFSLKNVGSGDTSNLVVTLLATDGVISPSGAQTYGIVTNGGAVVARPFTFIATGTCGGTLIATLHLQDGSTDLGSVTYTFVLGQINTPLEEDFDGVTTPNLPTDWTTSASGAQSNWVVSATQADTLPNAAFSPDPGDIGVNELVTPAFFVNSSAAQLMFRQNYSLAASTIDTGVGYDGGVLEIKIGGGSFQDIQEAGGSFISGGYDTTLSSGYGNPLAARQAWSGNSGGFLATTAILPAAAAGQNVQLRWRCGAGTSPAAAAIVEPQSFSGALAGWDMSTLPGGANNYGPSPFGATTSATNITVGGLKRGSGVTTSGGAAGRAWGGTGWIDASSADAITNNRFASFTVQANPGSSVSFSSISKFDYRRSSTGPPNGLVQYQVGPTDSFHDITTVAYTSTSSSGASIGPINLSGISALQNVSAGTIVTFHIVNWGGGGAGTWYIFDKSSSTASDFELQGDVTQGGVGGGWYIDSVLIEDAACCTP